MKFSALTNVMYWFYDNSPFLFKTTISAYAALLLCDTFVLQEEEPVYEVIMTNDRGMKGNSLMDGPMYYLFTDFINGSKETLYIELFTLKSMNVTNAIIDAKKRGVKVCIVTDFNFGLMHNPHIKELIYKGIEVYSNPGETTTLMHNKIMIRDGNLLCVTSMDPTEQAMCGSFNNFIHTNNKKLLDVFLTHFRKMKSDSLQFTKLFYRTFHEPGR